MVSENLPECGDLPLAMLRERSLLTRRFGGTSDRKLPPLWIGGEVSVLKGVTDGDKYIFLSGDILTSTYR
jgi:hypothetical protein